MPNSKQHRLMNINKPNSISNPTSTLHINDSNPLVGRNFRSIIRSSSLGVRGGMANSQHFVIRTLTSQNRRIYEQAQGRKQQYEAISQKIAEAEEAAKVPIINNPNPIQYLLLRTPYIDNDVVVTNTKEIQFAYAGSNTNG